MLEISDVEFLKAFVTTRKALKFDAALEQNTLLKILYCTIICDLQSAYHSFPLNVTRTRNGESKYNVF